MTMEDGSQSTSTVTIILGEPEIVVEYGFESSEDTIEENVINQSEN